MGSIILKNIHIDRRIRTLLFAGDGFSQSILNQLNVPWNKRVRLDVPLKRLWNPCKNLDGTLAGGTGDQWCNTVFPFLAKNFAQIDGRAIADANIYEISDAIRKYVESSCDKGHELFQYDRLTERFSAHLPHSAQQLRQLLSAYFRDIHQSYFGLMNVTNLKNWPWLRFIGALVGIPSFETNIVSLNYDIFVEQLFNFPPQREVKIALRSRNDSSGLAWKHNCTIVFKPHGSIRHYIPLYGLGYGFEGIDEISIIHFSTSNIAGVINSISDLNNVGTMRLPDIVPPAHAGIHLLNPYCRHDFEIATAAKTADVVIVFGASGRGPDRQEFELWLREAPRDKALCFFIGVPDSINAPLYSLLREFKNFRHLTTDMAELGVPLFFQELSSHFNVKIAYENVTIA